MRLGTAVTPLRWALQTNDSLVERFPILLPLPRVRASVRCQHGWHRGVALSGAKAGHYHAEQHYAQALEVSGRPLRHEIAGDCAN